MKDICKKIPITRQEMLEDTIEYYKADPIHRRSVKANPDSTLMSEKYSCVYNPRHSDNPKTSQGCAIGRYLTDFAATQIDKRKGISITSVLKDPELIPKIPVWMRKLNESSAHMEHPEEVRGAYSFLQNLQFLHDGDENWDANGITENGKSRVKKICETFELKYPEHLLN